ncbi:MAG: acyl-phosphate glycerol 3-phosphate acyltransferase [Acidimicrobiaceae bacterium]|nr:acyl-phosphate glycerol 3-phosphate acyltransferase [Acidimicrobiaceae bacterium]|tara:strand:+ start:190 stop:777 length:588 start_codon:yes stop_codon:yes gene_type:complete
MLVRMEWFLVAVAYALGVLPSAQLVAGRSGVDPTAEGSGNPGATNVYRTAGRRAGLMVFFADAGKGALAAGLGLAVGDRSLGLACWAAATFGHVLPATRRFRGGKGVATGGGGSLVLFPILGLFVAALFVVVARVSGKASLGSIVIAVALPAGVAATGRGWCEFLVAAGIAAMVLVRHEGNIRRLVSGEEQGFGR